MVYFDRKDDIWFVKWARAVKIRDKFECQICGKRGVELNAHHMNSWDAFADERYDISNGVTLCSTCHHGFHDIYKYGQNTREQYEEYAQMCEVLKDVILKKKRVEGLVSQIVSNLDGYDAEQ